MGKLVHGVRLAHEDRWVAHGAGMRQPGEDQVQSIVFSTIKYPTRTNRAVTVYRLPIRLPGKTVLTWPVV